MPPCVSVPKYQWLPLCLSSLCPVMLQPFSSGPGPPSISGPCAVASHWEPLVSLQLRAEMQARQPGMAISTGSPAPLSLFPVP